MLFTNDAYNKPQFQIYSKRFLGEKVNEKLKLVSKNTWIVLDQNFKFFDRPKKRSVYSD